MRVLAYAAIFGLGLIASGVAAADTWTDPAGRFKVDIPHGWRINAPQQNGFSYMEAGNAERECHFRATPNPATAQGSADRVRRSIQDDSQYTQQVWLTVANWFGTVFPHNSAQFVSRSQDNSGFWPMQRAELNSPNGAGSPPLPISTVHAALQGRPGVEIVGMCYTVSDPDYPTPDNPALFDPILRSMGTANDAALQAEAEAAAAAAAAPPAPAPATTPPTPQPTPQH